MGMDLFVTGTAAGQTGNRYTHNYDFPKEGRLLTELQRTYYIEQLVTGNNFQANLLTIKWMKNVNPPGR